MRKIFRKLISIEEALEVLEHIKNLVKPEYELVDLTECYNRVLAEDVYSPIDVPPFDRAAMDGYAVKAEDTFGADESNPAILKVVGEVETGEEPKVRVERGEAVRISTGAMMPEGANAVVMVEYTNENENLEVYKAVAPGENVLFAGSDIMAGELLVRAKSKITTREAGLLAACGIGKVKVYKMPEVAIISTGNELCRWDEKLKPGKIYDINTATLSLAVIENGGKVVLNKVVEDKEEKLKNTILDATEKAKIVITSGGTSAGEGDLVYKILDEVGELLVHGIAIKPGKPAAFGIVNGKPVFALPGYPTSAFMIFELFVSPLLRYLSGMDDQKKDVIAKVGYRITSPYGRKELRPVCLVRGEKDYFAYPLTGNYSAMISKLAVADGFIEIEENAIFLEESEVKVKLFSTLKPADLVIIGSHCIGLDVLLRISKLKAKTINVGSMGGLIAIKRGEADIAGTHLLDESGEYNIPFIKKLGLKNAVLIKGYLREQGLIVKKGNPKKIKWFEDLLREDVRIVNRNPGSGTRILLDMHLKDIAKKEGINFEDLTKKIKGYEIEAKTHTSVAVAVLSGRADVGLGIKSVADIYGLDFIPVRDEEYDFVVRKDRLNKKEVMKFLNALNSEEFARELKKLGMKVWDKTGEIIEIT